MKLKHSLLMGTAFALLAVVTLLGRGETAQAQTFNPSIESELVNPVAGEPSDFVMELSIPAGDVNFGGIIAYIPLEWNITPGEDIPIGAVVGQLKSLATLGIIGAQCDNVLNVDFTMHNASIDITDTVSFDDEDPEGEEGHDTGDVFEDKDAFGTVESATATTLTDSERDGDPFVPNEFVGDKVFRVKITDGTGDGQKRKIVSNTEDTITIDSDWDTVPDETSKYKVMSGLQDGLERYPEFINRITDNAQPIRRSAGVQIVAGADVFLQFLVFEPGSVIIREIPHEEELGYPTVTFLQAIGDPELDPEPNPITDFCTPLEVVNTTFAISKDNACTDDELPPPEFRGLCETTSAPLDIPEEGLTDPDESGHVLSTNPPAGDYELRVYALGQRDADGDGYENALDVCPFTPNQGDPRVKGDGDFDLPAPDGLDAACDPDDTVLNSDQDADGYLNKGDNCPLIANGEEESNQKDSDENEFGDARPDGIGDDCDPNPLVPDGELVLREFSSPITITGDAPPPEDDGDGDDDGGGALIFIIIGVIAAVVVLGGGGFFLMRRGSA